MKISKNNKGFTIIELLVVISIIGVLASIIFASLNSARYKARESTFIQELNQLVTIMELENTNAGNYLGLVSQVGWATTASDCDAEYGPSSSRTSPLSAQADKICKSITSISKGPYSLIVTSYATNRYSVEGWLDDVLLYCIGSSGKSYRIPSSGGTEYNNAGCHNNP